METNASDRPPEPFKKDFKKLRSSGEDLEKLAVVLRWLQKAEPLPETVRDHQLTGNYKDHRECHLAPDRLLTYRQTETELILVRTGSQVNFLNERFGRPVSSLTTHKERQTFEIGSTYHR